MSKTKAAIDFSEYKAADLGPAARLIHDSMTKNAGTFVDPAVAMTDLQTLIETYDDALVARSSQASADVLALKAAKEALVKALRVLGSYVNVVAHGDALIVGLSGFPSFSTARPPDTSPPAAPQDLRLTHGTLSGSILARYRPDRQRSVNQIQTTTGGPNNEADWHTQGYYRGGRAELSGLPPGVVVWVRVRTIGLNNVMGAWSDPAQLRVL